MKVLLLGGTRYMGRTAAMVLAAAGYEVVSVSRTPGAGGLHHRVCDRKDTVALEALLRVESPEAILDMICFDAGDGAGMARLFEAGSLPRLQHYLMVSTFFPYNHIDDREAPFVGDPATIADGYTRRKVEAEANIQTSPLFAMSTILRLPFVFSHDDYTGRFQRFCEMVRDGRVSPAAANGWKTSMIAMPDAARVLAEMVRGAPLGYADAANDGCLGLHEMAAVIATTLDMPPSFSGSEDPGTIYPLSRDLCLDSAKAPKLRPLADALADEAKIWSVGHAG